MADSFQFADLVPLLPELLLAVGALGLLMYGVFVGERSSPTVTGIAIALIAGV